MDEGSVVYGVTLFTVTYSPNEERQQGSSKTKVPPRDCRSLLKRKKTKHKKSLKDEQKLSSLIDVVRINVNGLSRPFYKTNNKKVV